MDVVNYNMYWRNCIVMEDDKEMLDLMQFFFKLKVIDWTTMSSLIDQLQYQLQLRMSARQAQIQRKKFAFNGEKK